MSGNAKFENWATYLAGQSLEGFLDYLAFHGPFVREVLAGSPRSSVEVGCGGANLSIFLSYLGVAATAVDLEEAVLREAERHAMAMHAPQVRFVQADGTATAFGDDDFDVSFSQGVLEHFNDETIERFLAESLRIAKRVVASVPNENYPTRDFGNERLMPPDFWRERGAAALRRRGGTGNVKVLVYRRRFDKRNIWRSLMNMVRRKCIFTLLVIERS
ncbi:MAG: class I SAM-dependent methyltransferase [Candidatus Sumerlaeaceae bacterium]|nr:class I SAM-dependent methyltransferase [Candidatus Sumerlaeaceae bacterium]